GGGAARRVPGRAVHHPSRPRRASGEPRRHLAPKSWARRSRRMSKEIYDRGLAIRKSVLGEAYVENALKNADEFTQPLQDLVTEYCWGWAWGREQLSKRDRSLMNLAMISILNRPHELRVHVKGAIRNVV